MLKGNFNEHMNFRIDFAKFNNIFASNIWAEYYPSTMRYRYNTVSVH